MNPRNYVRLVVLSCDNGWHDRDGSEHGEGPFGPGCADRGRAGAVRARPSGAPGARTPVPGGSGFEWSSGASAVGGGALAGDSAAAGAGGLECASASPCVQGLRGGGRGVVSPGWAGGPWVLSPIQVSVTQRRDYVTATGDVRFGMWHTERRPTRTLVTFGPIGYRHRPVFSDPGHSTTGGPAAATARARWLQPLLQEPPLHTPAVPRGSIRRAGTGPAAALQRARPR